MKPIIISLFMFLFWPTTKSRVSIRPQINETPNAFKLRYVRIGYGSNMFEMQPVFDVKYMKFIYTLEEVWIMPNQNKIERDTLFGGDFRKSSIDSILNIIDEIKDSSIYKSNARVSSGSSSSIEISNGIKKLVCNLHNTSDTTVDKIVTILNSYIPKEQNKLIISNFKSLH